MKEFITKNAKETQELAGKILRNVLGGKSRKTAAVLALEGELGGGKTTFVQGLAKALGVKEKILSPTFVIMKRFHVACRMPHVIDLYHIDCYRIDDPRDLLDLGFDEIVKDSKNLIVVEWADKVKSIIPEDAIWVKFEWVGEEERKIILTHES